MSAGSFAVALVSGGLDSMVSAALAKAAGHRLLALSVDYGQRHRVELDAAARVAAALGADRHVTLPLSLRAFGGSALTDDIAVPKDGPGEGIRVTYVPARNTVLLSLALAWAEAAGARDIWLGVHSLDHAGYPDCRPEFIRGFEALAELATKAGAEGNPFRIHAPLLRHTKADNVREGLRLGLDLSITWSCYDPRSGPSHCGLCDACRLRRDGFMEAGAPDPTDYAARP